MRVRHGLRADQPNDFDVLTQESIMELWRQISTAFFLVMVALSSVALMVGRHRCHGHHAGVSHRADPRDRHPQGHRRPAAATFSTSFSPKLRRWPPPAAPSAWPFGSGIGYAIYLATGFPVSLALVVVRRSGSLFLPDRDILWHISGEPGSRARPGGGFAVRIMYETRWTTPRLQLIGGLVVRCTRGPGRALKIFPVRIVLSPVLTLQT